MGSHTFRLLCYSRICSKQKPALQKLIMNNFGIAFVCVAVLAGAALAQDDNKALCEQGCNLLCETTGSLCVDVYPLVNCAANKAGCAASCGQTCECNAKCLTDCHTRNAECEAANANTFNALICKGQVTVCSSACPLTCAGQALTQSIQGMLGQALAGVQKAAEAAPQSALKNPINLIDFSAQSSDRDDWTIPP